MVDYTRGQMLNQLMWAEEDYYEDNKELQKEHVRKDWLDMIFNEYNAMETPDLADEHADRVDIYHDAGRYQILLKQDIEDLESGKRNLYVDENYFDAKIPTN